MSNETNPTPFPDRGEMLASPGSPFGTERTAFLDLLRAVQECPPEHLDARVVDYTRLQIQCAAFAGALLQRLVNRPADHDRLLTATEAAAELGVSVRWLQRRTCLPFRLQLSARRVRYSSLGIRAWKARGTVA